MTSHIDRHAWPERLSAHVVHDGDGGPPRIHGYDVEADLARHYPFSATVVLALTGELPDDARVAALDVALQFLAPVPVAQAPAHAAVLARVSGARTASVVAVGALGLCEQARDLLARHAETLAWLDGGASGEPPASARPANPDDDAATARLRSALSPSGLLVPALSHALAREAACLAVLHACGLGRPEQIETTVVLAGLPCVAAEAFAYGYGRIRDYPTNLPRFEHEEP